MLMILYHILSINPVEIVNLNILIKNRLKSKKISEKGMNQMGKRPEQKPCAIRYRYLILLFVSFFILFFLLYVETLKKVSETEPVSEKVESAAMSLSSPRFYISVQGGVVNAEDLENQKERIPLKNIDLRTMRDLDRRYFETGFYLYSEEELIALLEDYSS